MWTFIFIVKSLWKTTYFVMLIYRGHEQLTPIYYNCSGSSKKKLSQFGQHNIQRIFQLSQIFSGKGSTSQEVLDASTSTMYAAISIEHVWFNASN